MRSILGFSFLALVACSSQPTPPGGSPSRVGGSTANQTPSSGASAASSSQPSTPAAAAPEKLTADAPKTTTSGNTFIAPMGWTITVKGPATILEAPEGGSRIALVDVKAKDADAAVALAWQAYGVPNKWALKLAVDVPDKDGWTRNRSYEYKTSPNEKRDVGTLARFANDTWTVGIFDMDIAIAEKRGAQVGLIFSRLLPKGQERESFAGKKANPLDQARIAELGKFVETARQKLGVPGVSVGIIQDGKVVFAGGFGERVLGKKEKVDADTKFIIASNTKALTTLMLAKLVDEKKLGWETPATTLLPTFKLGDADTTSKVLVKHLICACTGLPRQDLEWLFQFQGETPESAMKMLGTMQPTSKFGELFQYSNPLAAAAGFIGGHVAFPKLDLGKAYDEAMQKLVFEPLGMKDTTFDFKKAQKGNFAAPHSPDVDGKTQLAKNEINYAVISVRPAGAAWSSVNDVLKYVQMELAEGKLPDGKVYVSKDALLARRAPQVALNSNASYGMGLMVDKTWGVSVVHHGGDMIGFHSDMMWLPEHGVGAVVLTNGDPGWFIRSVFQRKLLEVLFDGRNEADADIATRGKVFFEAKATERKLLTVPADKAEGAKLAAKYGNTSLGDIKVSHKGDATTFDFGEWQSDVASRKNPDGSISFITIAPGGEGFEFVVGTGPKKTLITRDAQHEYVFDEKK